MCIMELLPAYEARTFAQWVAEATEAYFENPENQKRFEQWKKERVLNECKSNS